VAPNKKRVCRQDPDDRLTYVLWQAQHACERRLVAALADTGLHISHFGILKLLHFEDGLTGAEIARRLDVTPQSISTAVAVARERGLVRATAHPVHRGLVELEITAAGRTMLAEIRKRVMSVDDLMSSVLSGDERATILKLLIRLRELLRKDETAAPLARASIRRKAKRSSAATT
jgi:DNA-binding MarR family transcriptional regulator